LSADAVIVGSPVYFGSISSEVKAFFDSWFKMGLFRDNRMRNKIGAAFAIGGSFSNGKELTILGIHAAMLTNQMVIASSGGGLGATATTGPDSPGIDEKELAEATTLGRRVAEVATIMKRGAATLAHNSPGNGKQSGKNAPAVQIAPSSRPTLGEQHWRGTGHECTSAAD
jgi:multimeric flavodoxin WrbA